MEKDKYFKDQRFMLIYMYSPVGFFVDDISQRIADEDGKSLVISGRSGRLEKPGSFLDNLGVLESLKKDSPYTYQSLWLEDDIYSDEALLEKYGNSEEVVEYIRHIGKAGNRPFSHKLIILAYDDGEDSEVDNPVIIKAKRGGYDLVIEYILSNFNNEETAVGEAKRFIHEHLCKDGVSRSFNFSLSSYFSGLDNYDFDFDMDADGSDYSRDYKRSIFNVDKDALARLTSMFLVPDRVNKILTEEQKFLLRENIPDDLSSLSDFIGLKLFKQKLPSFDDDVHRETTRNRARFWDYSNREFIQDDD